jgi:hypothetical protein
LYFLFFFFSSIKKKKKKKKKKSNQILHIHICAQRIQPFAPPPPLHTHTHNRVIGEPLPALPLVRDLTYRTKLGSRIGPKTTRVHEQQLLLENSPTQVVLEASVWTPDVPYGDSFSVVSRYVVTPCDPGAAGGASCHVHVSLGCNFSRSVWVKGFIEKNAFAGGCDFLKLWTTAARRRLESSARGHASTVAAAALLAGAAGKGAAGSVRVAIT